ncbi:MAG TPA: 3-phosphoshikimate 1-carboxyvinyltransferase [Humidesulfovibrio sp.]|uniref:3-phosphoshikimate 1-carboxyvinyltransferase n=1 Tax=Humidesulfovibrio sp. TaxID=2910988 RepID=UPI002CA1C2AF|nr:3-phosphoshikimate 1-carboxyvinyltransferase [Humidesulfovibrio sp.]HWR03130.1 3-phosphoshikimate 1-carboxyvinyltransferase [Humidesulfovibrio sp.]
MSLTPILVEAPASKSLSHRALICAALAKGESRLTGVLESQDTERTMACLTACGARFRRAGAGEYAVVGMAHGPEDGVGGAADLNVGESGTTCRLLAGVVAAGQGRFRIHGEGRMHQRPLGEPARALASQGVRFAFEENEGYPPVTISTTGLPGGEVDVRLEESSQYLSGILLAAPLARGPLTIAISGTKAVSWPYVSLTLQAMADFGAPAVVEALGESGFAPVEHTSVTHAEPGKLRFLVAPGSYAPRTLRVEGDWSNASYFLAAGAVGKRPVRVSGLRADSLQGDRAILDILAAMGAQVDWDAEGSAVTVSPRALTGVSVDMGACPDLVPTVAVAACFAKGPTTITNVAHLRIKESDRLEALAVEIAKTGCGTEMFADGLTITPAPLKAGQAVCFDTRADHRLVMGPALFALAGLDVGFDNPGCVAKSFPGFWGAFDPIRNGQGA